MENLFRTIMRRRQRQYRHTWHDTTWQVRPAGYRPRHAISERGNRFSSPLATGPRHHRTATCRWKVTGPTWVGGLA